jgi:hypothetical protein
MDRLCSVCHAVIRRWMVIRIDGNAPRRTDLCVTCRAVFRRLGVLEDMKNG